MLTLKHLSKIALAILRYHVDGIKGLVIEWRDDFNDVYEVRMVQFLEYNYFTKDALSIYLVVEQPSDFFDGHLTYRYEKPSHRFP